MTLDLLSLPNRVVAHVKIFITLILLYFPSLRLCALDQSTTERIAIFCKIWGFLKYYHPGVTEKAVSWDNAFIDHYPDVKKAASRAELNEILWSLYQRVNSVEPADEGDGDDHSFDEGIQITDFLWLKDTIFEKRLRDALWNLKKQGVSGKSFYVEPLGFKGMPHHPPNVDRDNGYYNTDSPTEPERVLALARYWNIINYYAPNKNAMVELWDSLLCDFIPKVAEATDSMQYILAMFELSRKTNDGNAAFQNDPLIKYLGADGIVPVELSFIEGKTVVTGGRRWTTSSDSLLAEVGLFKGDIIVSINGKPIADCRTALLPYVTFSNEDAREHEICQRLLRGKPDDTVKIVVEGALSRREVVTTYRSYEFLRSLRIKEETTVVGQFNSDGTIGYIDVSKLDYGDDIRSIIKKLSGTRALILDHRNSPRVMIAHYLTAEKTYAHITEPNYEFPGFIKKGNSLAVGWTTFVGRGKGAYADTRPIYRGRIAVLVNEQTQGYWEMATMALQAIPNVITLGSQTAGATGSPSTIWLPGKIKVSFSGDAITYPDGTPTHRLGVKIDVEVKPTIKGIREGKDDVLEYALDYLQALEQDKE